MKRSWRDRLFDGYVSSGQAGEVESDAEKQFSPRQPYIQEMIRRHVPADRKVHIFDAGCGSGAWLYFRTPARMRPST